MKIPEGACAVYQRHGMTGPALGCKDWIGCEGNFQVAVGYASIFWPKFILFEMTQSESSLLAEPPRTGRKVCEKR